MALVARPSMVWTVPGSLGGLSGGENVLGKENSKENKVNDYFRRRCVNYERFLCDRVWECALCAKQSGKVVPLEGIDLTQVEALRRR